MGNLEIAEFCSKFENCGRKLHALRKDARRQIVARIQFRNDSIKSIQCVGSGL